MYAVTRQIEQLGVTRDALPSRGERRRTGAAHDDALGTARRAGGERQLVTAPVIDRRRVLLSEPVFEAGVDVDDRHTSTARGRACAIAVGHDDARRRVVQD